MTEIYSKRRSFGSFVAPLLIHTFCYRLAKAVVTRDGTPRRFTYKMSATKYKLPRYAKRFFGEEESDLGETVFVCDSKRPGKVIFYIHGGAYWTQPTYFHFSFLHRVIESAGGLAVMPVYPKAPSHNCRDAYDMITAAYDSACGKYSEENIVLMGDSAGGGFILSFAMLLASQGRRVPPAIAISPWLDLTCENDDIRLIKDPWLDPPSLAACGRYYAGELSLRDPLVSPLFGDVSSITRTSIFIGTNDVMFPDCRDIERKNRNIKLFLYPKMNHVFPIYRLGHESADAFERIIGLIGES